MIAKPAISESDIRSMIEGIDGDIRSGLVKGPTGLEIWTSNRRRLVGFLEDWKLWRKQTARHQRPSVRHHITRRVKTPI
jgi:hypothetical protein